MDTPCQQRHAGEFGIMDLQHFEGIAKTNAYRCRFGVMLMAGDELAFVNGASGFLTNSQLLADQMNKRCDEPHTRVTL